MKNKGLLTIAGAVVLFLLGLVIGLAAGGPSTEDIEAAVGKRLDEAASAQNERLAAVEAGVDGLKSDLAGRLEGLGAGVEAGKDAVAGIGENVAGLGQSIAAAVKTASADQLAALESGLARLRDRIAAPAPTAEPAAPDAAAPAAAATSAPVEGFGPGETGVLADGAVRVFVSRIDDADHSATVRVNGKDLVLAMGQPQTLVSDAGECRLTLDAVGGGKAAVSAACGDALPAPEGARPGETVALGDGLRVFVSHVSDSGARIAINGTQIQTVGIGESVEARVGETTCSVSVTGVDRGHVALTGSCG
ncbi:hypothetical protein [Amaricoccus sp.]|uniref:hypothetical protein n=1 Tax=Amaricoccus sp. TaxID=1872485 RepID=UPI001B4B503D|nr:hypothetical protein [Amaricoccus sp.]MBP7242347.1 hypothetical protein [Amaricoccus sp.]